MKINVNNFGLEHFSLITEQGTINGIDDELGIIYTTKGEFTEVYFDEYIYDENDESFKDIMEEMDGRSLKCV